MSNATQILVKLSAEGSAILGGIGWAALDLPPGFSVRSSKDVNALSDINNLITDGLLSFDVPMSTVNDAAFMSFSSPIITNNSKSGIEARVICEGHELPFDHVWIKGKNDVQRTWEIDVRRSPNHWLELASEKKLCTIELGNVTLDDTATDTWADQFAVDSNDLHRWIPADYGGWVDLSEPIQFTDPPVKHIWLEDLRPFISFPNLLKLGFCEIGWTLEGQILETELSRAIFVYILSREYFTQSKGGNHKLIGQLLLDFTNATGLSVPIFFTSLQYDPGGNSVEASPGLYSAAIQNTLPFKARYKFTISGQFENVGATVQTYEISLGETDNVGNITGLVYATFVFKVNALETLFVTTSLEADIEPNAYAGLAIQSNLVTTIKTGCRIIIEPNNKSLVRGDVVALNRLINCEYYLLGAFKGYVHFINGRIETDWANRRVIVHPYRTADVYADNVPGFINDGATPIDLDAKVVCNSARLTRVKNDLTRYTQLQFADTTDAYIDSLKLDQPAYSRRVLNSIELPDKVTELKNPFFEPTLEGRPDALKRATPPLINHSKDILPMVYLPRLWDNSSGERSFNIGPRALVFFGETSQFDEGEGRNASFYFEGTSIDFFGYASQLPTLGFATGLEPTLVASLVYGSTERDLYVTFYLALLQKLKRGAYLDLLVYMNSNDYSAWDFRTKFKLTYNGRQLLPLGESIRDFAHGADIPTPMKFLVEPSDTECCDLPCSCRFTECDYYQDFGQYMTQDTLDQLSVTSFKINEIEQLLAPADFGIINVVEVNGRQFVTNLVDTLNALAIDYFGFRASTKTYADKLDQRFFKIKRPACWSFEIIISDTEGEVYRYRDYDMAQKWFDADWEPMGYAGNPVSEPEDCITTIEY
jgi:hypothetical protein